MNILVVCHYGLYQDLSSSFVHAQAKAYAALGHRVRVVIPIPIGKVDPSGKVFGRNILFRVEEGVELCYVRHLSVSKYGTRWFNQAMAFRAVRSVLKKMLRDFRPDVVHAHTLSNATVGLFLKNAVGCPLVVTTHGSDASIPYERGDMQFLRQSCDKADAVVAVSSALAKKVHSCGTTTPIYTVLNGFYLKYVSEEMEKDSLRLIQVGHLNEQKRVHVTIDAFAKLREKYSDAKLEIVGSGPQKEVLREQCQALGLSEFICFAGQVPNEQALEKMAKAKFFVMPSVREGFGIVYLEAMASGCITIGTQGEGIADVIVSGKNGFLVPPDDVDAIVQVIAWCIENPKEAAAISECGRRDAQTLTWDKNAKEYIEMFKTLM